MISSWHSLFAAHKNQSVQKALKMAAVDVLLQNTASKGSEGRTEEDGSCAQGSENTRMEKANNSGAYHLWSPRVGKPHAEDATDGHYLV